MTIVNFYLFVKYFHILPIFLLLFASSDKYPLQNYQKWRQVIIYLSTGLPTKDETVKTTENSENVMIPWLN